MKPQTLVATSSVVVGLGALHRFGPALHRRAMGTCQKMYDRMAQGAPTDQTTGDSPDAWTSVPCCTRYCARST